MPRSPKTCLPLIGLFLIAGFARGAEVPEDERGDVKTLLYVARNVAVADLANALSAVLEARNEDASVVAQPVTNHLLITGGPPTLEKVTKILAELDKPPKMVSIVVQIIQASRTLDSKQDASKPSAAWDFVGPAEKVLANVRELEKSGHIASRDRIQLATLDNQEAFVQVGARKPLVTGVSYSRSPSTAARSGFSRPPTTSVRYENVGMIVRVVPRVTPDGLVVMELSVEKSDLDSSATDSPPTEGEGAASIRTPQINSSTAETTVSVASGQTVVLGGVASSAAGRQSQLIVLVSAEIQKR